MNFLTIFCVSLILYSIDTVTGAKNRGPIYRNPPRIVRDSSEESSEEYDRNSVCRPRALRDIIAIIEQIIVATQVDLHNFGISQQNVDYRLKNVDSSLNNIQNSIYIIRPKLDEHAELIKSFNDTVNASVKNCNKVYAKIDGILDEVSTTAKGNTRTSETVSGAQIDLQNELVRFNRETETSIGDLTTLIDKSVLSLLDNLEASSAKIETDQQLIKSEVKMLRDLRILSENIVVNVKAIQGQITRLNETEEARLNELKEQIQQLIIKNAQCLRGRPYHKLLAELRSIALKLSTCTDSENLLTTGLADLQTRREELLKQLDELKSLTDIRLSEILQKQTNYAHYNRYPLSPRPY